MKRTKTMPGKLPRRIISLGSLGATLLLCLGFFFPKASFLARSMAQCAVNCFAVAVIGGLLLDVINRRRDTEN